MRSLVTRVLGIFAFMAIFLTINIYASTNGVISAEASVDGEVLRGETFNISLNIDGNSGFAGMMFRLSLPEGLELVGLSRNDSLVGIGQGFAPVPGWTGGFIIVPPATGDVFVGWAGRTTDFTANGNLLNFTVLVRHDAPYGELDPITLAFRNALYYETPTNVNGDELEISINGVMAQGQSVEIARVSIYDNTPAIITTSLPVGMEGVMYQYQLQARNFPLGASWMVWELPSGLFLNQNTGVISGTPNNIGTFHVTVSIIYQCVAITQSSLEITILEYEEAPNFDEILDNARRLISNILWQLSSVDSYVLRDILPLIINVNDAILDLEEYIRSGNQLSAISPVGVGLRDLMGSF